MGQACVAFGGAASPPQFRDERGQEQALLALMQRREELTLETHLAYSMQVLITKMEPTERAPAAIRRQYSMTVLVLSGPHITALVPDLY